jgi:hypothetical protein
MADPYRIFETAGTQPIECMQLGPACFPGLLLSFLSSATELSFYLEVICQLDLFPGYVLGDKTKEGKQITTEAHLPVVRACHQQSIPAPFPGVPRKISLTFDLLLNMGFLPLGLYQCPAHLHLSIPQYSGVLSLNPAPYQAARWVSCCVL